MAHQFPRSEVLLTGMGLQLQGRLQFGPIQVGLSACKACCQSWCSMGAKTAAFFRMISSFIRHHEHEHCFDQ